jgi:hypothetical protein
MTITVKEPEIIETLTTQEVVYQDVRALRYALGQSLTEFGWTLKRALEPHAKRPYTRQYISRLEHGQDRLTDEIIAAYQNILGQLKKQPAATAGTIPAQVMVMPGQIPEGVIPLLLNTSQVVQCARPGCPVWFVKDHHWKKYHDKECRPIK